MGNVISIGKLLEMSGGIPQYTQTTHYTSAGLNRVTGLPEDASSFIICANVSNGNNAFVDSVGYGTYVPILVAFIRTGDTICSWYLVEVGNTGSGSSPPVRFNVDISRNRNYTTSQISGKYPITLTNGTLQFYARDFWSNYQGDYVLTAHATIYITVW